MKTVGVSEAKTHLAQLLDDVARGEEVTITRHGQPVARLVSARPTRDPEKVAAAVAQVRVLSRGKHATADEIREWIDAGRRF